MLSKRRSSFKFPSFKVSFRKKNNTKNPENDDSSPDSLQPRLCRPRTKSTPGGNIWTKKQRSVRRHRCSGSVELLVSVDESGKIRNIARFRVEPGPASADQDEDSSAPNTPVIFENPQTETRWYYRYFLGQEHQNFAAVDPCTKSPFFFSVMVEDTNEETTIRAIQWTKTDLGILEDQEGSINFKFGVIFAKHGQNTDDEMLSNVNSTGKTSMYTTFGGHEIMFHVSTLLPHSTENRQQVEKKRHIGNDIVDIIFESDGDPTRPTFNPSVMKSHFTLINGERAAFKAQAFGEKRERTNDTLIKDMYIEYLKDSHKHGLIHKASEPVIKHRRSPKSKEVSDDQIEFIKLGELLKLEKMLSGEAPYTLDATLVRKQLFSGQHSLLIGTERSGVILLNQLGTHTTVIDEDVKVQQISVLEPFGIVLLRCEKGCHFFGVTDSKNLRLSLAVAVGRKVLLLRWALGHFGRVEEETKLSKNFTVLKEITLPEEILCLSVFECGLLATVRACVATKHNVELVNFSKASYSTVYKVEDTKTTISSVNVATEAEAFEVVINYGNITVILDPEETQSSDSLKLFWTSTPDTVEYSFPFVFAFAYNLMEVRLAINGNLLATNYLPGVRLLASKEDILFATEPSNQKTWSLYRMKHKTNPISDQQDPRSGAYPVVTGSRTPNLSRSRPSTEVDRILKPKFEGDAQGIILKLRDAFSKIVSVNRLKLFISGLGWQAR